jgi:hypothetical protein
LSADFASAAHQRQETFYTKWRIGAVNGDTTTSVVSKLSMGPELGSSMGNSSMLLFVQEHKHTIYYETHLGQENKRHEMCNARS